MILPNFIIAGTARSGTTSLYYYLKQHPEIGFPEKKEPKFFSSKQLTFPHTGPGDSTVDKLVIRNFSSYKKLFSNLNSKKMIGEASSDYLFYHQHTAKEIKETLGDIPIILCLRNPIDRTYSAYTNMLRDQRETLSFSDALRAEKDRLNENWDWMWAYKSGGLYADQVQTYINTFSKVKIILFDDLKNDSDKLVSEIFSFLGVNDSFVVNTSTRYGNSGKPKNKLIALLSNRENKLIYTLRRIIFKLIPRSLLEKVASKSFDKDEMSQEDRNYLKEYFSSDISRLETILNRNLDNWK